MNVGQIYESLLGLAGFYKNEFFRIPPFDENYDFQFSRNLVYWQLNELNRKHYFSFPSKHPAKREKTNSKHYVENKMGISNIDFVFRAPPCRRAPGQSQGASPN